MAEERNIIARFEEEDETPQIELDESEIIEDDGSEIEEISAEELEEVEAAGGKAGDFVVVGNYIYMVVSPRNSQFCGVGKKGPNSYPKPVKMKTCSCCMYMFKKKGYWLCKQTKTHV